MFVNKHFETLRVCNSTIPRIKSAKFSGQYVYMNTSM